MTLSGSNITFDASTFHSEISSIMDEILRYKWIESEKRGYDIGRNQAALEWIEKYLNLWKEYHRSANSR